MFLNILFSKLALSFKIVLYIPPLFGKECVMNILLGSWVYDTKDSFSAVWRSIAHGVLFGSSEGIIIYLLMKTFGIFSVLSIYG